MTGTPDKPGFRANTVVTEGNFDYIAAQKLEFLQSPGQFVDDNGFSLIQLFDVAIALHLTASTCMLQTSFSSRGVEWVAGLPISVRRLLLCLVVIPKQDCSKKLQKASIGRWRAIPDPDRARAATCYKARAVTCYRARVVTCYGAKVVIGYGARIVTCDGAKAFTCYARA